MSNFQDELRNEDGYEEIVIIAVGQTNISTFNNNFCANSDLPLVMDQYPALPIREQFGGDHKEIIILDRDSNEIGSIIVNGLSTSAKNYIRGVIADNYEIEPDPVMGDLNGDEVVNIQDVILVINVIINGVLNPGADINGDGVVNVQDIVLIVNIIIG